MSPFCPDTFRDTLHVWIFAGANGNLSVGALLRSVLQSKACFFKVLLNSVFVRGISMKTGAEPTQGCGRGQRQYVALSTLDKKNPFTVN